MPGYFQSIKDIKESVVSGIGDDLKNLLAETVLPG